MMGAMTRDEVTQQILASRATKGLTWQQLADAIDTAARPVGTQHRRIASPKRNSSASHAVTAPRPTNTPCATSYGLDWPFTRKPHEKKPAGDRVVVTFDGKFLPYDWTAAQG